MNHQNKFLKYNLIYETIVSTYNSDGTPNAAPMGIIYTDKDRILIKTYKYSDTYYNLKDRHFCVVNFTQDPELFVQSTLFQEELMAEDFSTKSEIKAPILTSCLDNYIALQVTSQYQDPKNDLRVIYECKIIHKELKRNTYFTYTRAFSSLVEILIHATRIQAFKVQNNKADEIVHLMELIDHHANIIERVTDEDILYNKLVEKIRKKIMI